MAEEVTADLGNLDTGSEQVEENLEDGKVGDEQYRKERAAEIEKSKAAKTTTTADKSKTPPADAQGIQDGTEKSTDKGAEGKTQFNAETSYAEIATRLEQA